MPQEIAAYIDVSSATLIDVDSGQINAASTSITALSVTIPNGHSADHLIAVFVKPFLFEIIPSVGLKHCCASLR
jgi:hypothetical protein